MPTDCIYNNEIQYIRKTKSRICQLKIDIVRRCQDILVAIITDNSDRNSVQNFIIYGYECNNDIVSLIGNKEIHQIKFEKLETVLEFTDLLVKYVKDVCFKIQLKSCDPGPSILRVNEWYTFHVQANRICLTTDSGKRVITKWDRSNIGRCSMKDHSLHIEIISKRDKSLYHFYRDEKFPIEKIFKSIQNLKFELPLPLSEKFISTPRRSGSVDLKGVISWGSAKERINRDRTCSSSKVDDSLSYDDSSPSSTPCSPSFSFGAELTSSTKNCNDIDEKNEELMFPLDSTDTCSGIFNIVSKTNGFLISDERQRSPREFNNKKLVDLERFPFASDPKIQGKLSPELNSPSSNSPRPMHIRNANVYDNTRNSSCYQTMDFIKHHRKASSEANFLQHKNENEVAMKISQSVDTKSSIRSNFKNTLVDDMSASSSPYHLQSYGNLSSDTHASSNDKDQEESRVDLLDITQEQSSTAISSSIKSVHNYYNISNNFERNILPNLGYPQSFTDDSEYYNLSFALSNSKKKEFLYANDEIDNGRNSTVSYVDLDFQDNTNEIISKKISALDNYTVIDIHQTEILRDLDDNLKHVPYKKKRPHFLKFFKKQN